MLKTIEEYYKKASIMPLLLKQKMAKMSANPDIAEEFAFWITKGIYKKENAINIEGYTAESIAKLSPYMDGEGAFILMIELREKPEKAKKRIADGFKMK